VQAKVLKAIPMKNGYMQNLKLRKP